MKIHSNISPLPFYADINEQNHRKSYAYGQVYPLISAGSYILPFQFIYEDSSIVAPSFSNDYDDDFTTVVNSSSIGGIKAVRLISLDSGLASDITVPMVAQGLGISQSSSGLFRIKFPGGHVAIKPGYYYLELSFTGTANTLYSDVFLSTSDVSNCVRIDYANSLDLALPIGSIDFSDNFRFTCFLDATIGKPEYSYEEEATSRNGYAFVESQVCKKIYKFTVLAPEYLCDALRIVRLCNEKIIRDRHKTYTALSFSMDVKWEDQGDLASIECEFETDTVIFNIGNTK
jgi:hypothetical protein